MPHMNLPLPTHPRAQALAGLAILVMAAAAMGIVHEARAKPEAASSAGKAALTVTLVQPQRSELAQSVSASGNVAAWQEASIGSESSGWRLAEVRVNVGDAVKKGQVLATFAPDLLQADVSQVRSVVAEAEAALAEAAANAARARELQTSGALSDQQINQFMTA